LKITPEIIAVIKLEIGPAAATKRTPYFLFLKLLKFTGTGFAHPNNLVINKTNSPIISICAKGLSVSLPANFAVLSPNLYAI